MSPCKNKGEDELNKRVKSPMERCVWVVEDSEADAEALLLAADAVSFGASLRIFTDGDQVLSGLEKADDQGISSKELLPTIILLDLNLPNTDGRSVLQQVKQTAVWRKIPVLVLTTSNHPRDVGNCYDMGANAYIVKPLDLDQLEAVLCAIDKFWLQCAVRP